MENISIITVCYNAEKTISRTIQSVLIQNYSNIEYILIDGASKDSTNDIIEDYRKEFENKSIKYVHISEPDEGIYDAMNKGAKYATGVWVNYLNADDAYVDENTISDIFYEYNGKYDAMYGDTINILDGNSFYRESNDMGVVFFRNPYVHQALFIKKSVLQEFEFDLSYKYAADFDQAVRLYLAGKNIIHIQRPICFFSLGGVSQKNTYNAICEFERIRIKNHIAHKCIIKRFILYLLVLIIKNNTILYNAYIHLKKMISLQMW